MRAIAPGDRRLCARCRTFKDEIEFDVILRRKPKEDCLDILCSACRRADRHWPRWERA